jgi:hypothetical protein
MICERRDRVLCVTEEHAMCGSEECACMRVLYRRGRQVCIRHKCAHRAIMDWPILHTSVYSTLQFHILRG